MCVLHAPNRDSCSQLIFGYSEGPHLRTGESPRCQTFITQRIRCKKLWTVYSWKVSTVADLTTRQREAVRIGTRPAGVPGKPAHGMLYSETNSELVPLKVLMVVDNWNIAIPKPLQLPLARSFLLGFKTGNKYFPINLKAEKQLKNFLLAPFPLSGAMERIFSSFLHILLVYFLMHGNFIWRISVNFAHSVQHLLFRFTLIISSKSHGWKRQRQLLILSSEMLCSGAPPSLVLWWCFVFLIWGRFWKL